MPVQVLPFPDLFNEKKFGEMEGKSLKGGWSGWKAAGLQMLMSNGVGLFFRLGAHYDTNM
jgi:hypothetical protein